MSFRLKAGGSTLALALVFAAVTANAGLAQQGELSSEGPVTLTGTETGEEPVPVTLTATQTGGKGANALTAFGGELECPSATYAGYRYGTTPHEAIPNGEDRVTITPDHGACSGVGATATVTMNGCDYVLELEGTSGEDAYDVKTEIACPAEKHVQIRLFAGEAHGEAFCTLTITEQAGGYAGLVATDATDGTLDLAGTLEGIAIHKEGEGILCAEKATTEEAQLHLDLQVEGRNSKAAATDISIAEEGEDGVLVAHDGEPESGPNALTAFGDELECPGSAYTGHQLDGEELLDPGETSFTLTPHYKQTTGEEAMNCRTNGALPATVTTNGCDFVHRIGETVGGEHTYAITVDIVCPEGKAIEWHTYLSESESVVLCETSIDPQEGLTGLHATSDTESGDFVLKGTLTGVHVEGEGVCVGEESTTGKGKLDVDMTVEGHDNEANPSEVMIVDEPTPPGNEGLLTVENEERATLTGVETGVGSNVLTAFGSALSCPGSTYTGHEFETTPHELLTHGDRRITITPHYKQKTAEGKINCKVGGLPTTITMNGCDYELYDFTAVEGEHDYSFTTGIVCPGASKIELETYLGEGEGVNACAIKVGSQTDLTGGRAVNTPASGEQPSDIDLTGTITGIHFERSGLCVSEDITTTNGAEQHLDVTLTADDEVGELIGISLSHEEE